jgi:hypothetical protein
MIMNNKIKIAVFFFFGLLNLVYSQDFRSEDKARLKEAFEIGAEYGDKLWKGYNQIPYIVLFITDSNEYLINHPNPTSDFKDIGYDSILQSEVYTRHRKYPVYFLATFGAVNDLNTIIVGTPENTNRTSGEWIVTILHEHFHQLQYSKPDYESSVASLDLKNGDTTGMWMLNFPFPYENADVAKQFNVMTISAQKTAFAETNSDFKNNFTLFMNEREKFKGLLSDKEYRYFSFQLWQEGLAMYTEAKMFELVKDSRKPGADITALKDFTSYPELYTKKIENIKNVSVLLKLDESKRACFYYIGALEGLILDRVNPDWRERYFTEKFYIERYYK